MITINSDGTVTGGTLRSPGNIIQSVSLPFDAYTSDGSGLRAESGTYTDSGMEISITPTVSTSKILVISTGTSFGYQTSSTDIDYFMRLVVTPAGGSLSELREIEVRKTGEGSATQRLFDSWSMISNHDHNTTSALTYKVQHKTATAVYAWARYKGGDMHLLEIAT
tara:strand:+ start:35 stop:532 length:498 start_codon:yes stop_codon:yes gene_type:complete